MKMFWKLLLWSTLLLPPCLWFKTSYGLTRPTSVKLENNGYTGIVIAIHHSEAENQTLIEVLTRMVTEASTYLYEATKHRAYFKEVMILIPDTWQDKPEYQSPLNATFEGADIIVAPRNPRFAPSAEQTPIPHTKHYDGCGKQAVHIHMTSEYLLKPNVEFFSGSFGRVLVHEWGHYRWGLFNEYADDIADPDNVQHIYRSTVDRKHKPTRCPAGLWDVQWLKGTDPCMGDVFNGFEEGCVGQPRRNQPHISASIMSGDLIINQIVNFCDNGSAVPPSEQHNSEAPNKHNRLCDRKSNWAVMREHSDFRNGANPPRTISDVTPTILLARRRPIRVVTVLDSSGSMSDYNRIDKLARAARAFLTSVSVDGSYIGIVDFDSIGVKQSGLTLINSDETRDSLANLVPTEADGGTCIGCGLETALEILSENGASPAGGIVLLITDGIDGNAKKTGEMKEIYIQENVIIDVVAFGDKFDENLTELSIKTGGKIFLQTDNPGSTGLYDAFLATMQSGVKEYDRRIELHSSSAVYKLDESRSHGVFIDHTVGRRTSFTFDYLVDTIFGPAVDVTITTPSGVVIDSSYDGYGIDLTFKRVSVKFDLAEPGLWSYDVSNVHFEEHEVLISISTYPSQENVDPITATAELSGSITNVNSGEILTAFAEVKQGFYPVVNASVVATIERPPDAMGIEYDPFILKLYDNGAGADVTRDDGIYSRYFINITGIGYYGIKIDINNNDNRAVILKPSGDTPFSGTSLYVDPDDILQGKVPKLGNVILPLPGEPLPPPEIELAPKFTRGISGGSSRVPALPADFQPGKDIYPPCKIIDLRVKAVSYENRTVTLQFTAPGNDLDSGNASFYIMRKSSSPEQLLSNYGSVPPINQTDILKGDLRSPGRFGDLEEFIISVAVPSNSSVVTYIFGLHAVDEAGNEGDKSNLVQATLRAFIPQPLMTTQRTTVDGSSQTTSKIMTTVSASTPLMKKPGRISDKLVTILSAIAAVILVIIVVALCLLLVKLKCGNKAQRATPKNLNTDPRMDWSMQDFKIIITHSRKE
ncbi:Calcium-activated chloride channel regulator 1 [Holothuria leucospilota]|uniref:Calcium-activated chloride channel regulator 1 n=1 Tax=Holothuria leucospilota TaxID=206669 RepID=A0A9Q1CM71_HOLLE|nr:Calcium-activated chloride channel regulator 1 [Holothuria leucospilota]